MAAGGEKHRKVVDLTQSDAVQHLEVDSIACLNYNGLAKFKNNPLEFDLVIMDEADAQKGGKFSYDDLEDILGSHDITTQLRFGMTASAYHKDDKDVQRPLAFVMGNQSVVKWDIMQLLQVVPQKYGPSEHSKHTDWYYRAELPKLPCRVNCELLVLSYECPEEIRVYEAYSSNAQCATFMDRGLFRSEDVAPVKGQQLAVADSSSSSSSSQHDTHPDVEKWPSTHLIPNTLDEAAHGSLCASGISLEDAQSTLHNYKTFGGAPQKALFIVMFANSRHPDRPIIVTYKHTALGEAIAAQFRLAHVDGFGGVGRQVFLVGGHTKKQDKVVRDFKKAIADNFLVQRPMPVLVGQTQVLSTGWDGLQEHANIMIQAQLEDDPQTDMQAIYRLVRHGQKETVHIYRVMMNTPADKTVLYRQITRIAGWKQNRFNPRDVKELLCLPPSWEREPQP